MSSIVAPDRYGDVPATIGFGWRDHVPGLLIVALGTLAAGFLSDHYGAPLTLMALLLGLLAGTAVVQYREHQREEMAQGVMHVTPVAAVLPPDVLQNFDAIHQLGHVPTVSEEELLAALQ